MSIKDLKALAANAAQLGQITDPLGADAIGLWRGAAGEQQVGWATLDALLGDVNPVLTTVTPISAYVNTADGVFDNTLGLQAAIDAAPAGGTVLGDPTAHYFFRNLVIEKSLTLDFNGARVTVDPTTDGVLGDPAIWGRGALGTPRGLAANISLGATALTVAAGETDFEVGDYVLIRDDEVVPGWSAEASGYTGKFELNQIEGRIGAAITLGFPTINTYRTTDDARITKLAATPQIHVRNIRHGTEIDPGGAYTGSLTFNVPHIIHFQHCFMPSVENVHFAGLQLHAVNAHRCINPTVRACSFANGFRTSTGGHAYGARFHTCLGGVAVGNLGSRMRHLFDTTASSYNFSAFNTDLLTGASSYTTHGSATTGWSSYCDSSIGEMGTNRVGFGLGNPDFNLDRRLTLISPRVEGVSTGIQNLARTEDCTIVNAVLRTKARGIHFSSGAKRLKIQGGIIDLRGATGTPVWGIFSRAKVRDADSLGEAPVDLEITGTTILTGTSGNAIRIEDLGGTVKMTGVTCVSQSGVPSVVDVGTATAPANVIVQNCTFRGVCERHLRIREGVSGTIAVTGNTFEAHTALAMNIEPVAKMIVALNTMDAAGDLFFADDVPAGAVVALNAPEAV